MGASHPKWNITNKLPQSAEKGASTHAAQEFFDWVCNSYAHLFIGECVGVGARNAAHLAGHRFGADLALANARCFASKVDSNQSSD